MAQTGDNVQYKIADDKLTITVDLSVKGKRSASGKSIVLASSRGNVEIAKRTFLGLNIYRKT